MPKLHLEPLLFCIAWAAVAIIGGMADIWAGILLSGGLLLVLMPISAAIISRMENAVLERQVRWGILAIAALGLAASLQLSR